MPSWANFSALSLLALSTYALAKQEAVDRLFKAGGVGELLESVDNATSPNPVPRDLLTLVKRDCPRPCASGYCCASDGLCINSLQDSCCGGFFCNPGYQCCHDGCILESEECCKSGGYCKTGYECWKIAGVPKCCPGGDCDGDVDVPGGGGSGGSGGSTITRSSGGSDYFTWTVTWTYWVTFYTYYIPSSRSIRTSTSTTTKTTVSFYATDSLDASSSFNDFSATMTFAAPASATDPPTPTDTGFGGSGSSPTSPGGNGLVAAGGVGALRPSAGIWSWNAVLMACAALVPGLLAVYL
ncbi:hypothetical protein FQN50_004636 [Emmonsiellopsis sp. PD_5]|nr:hypothetical protein FQN50_004636 [Emmonsiellopsis sp. PD_5]